MSFVLAASRPGYAEVAQRLAAATGAEFHLVENREDFTLANLVRLDPDLVFLPHWSFIIPAEIHQRFECVIFHMTDVPFGRGGSPLQNLLSRGIYQTQLSALRCVAELDAGPVYLKRPFDLEGTAEEIYARGALLVEQMIQEIVATRPEPVPQSGEPVVFKRRRPEQSNLAGLTDPRKIYDHIRMLDAEGYPHAFVEVGGLRVELTGAELTDGQVTAKARIVNPEKEDLK